MPISETIEPPEWIDSGAEITGGLDLTGLRVPVQNFGTTLLDGITTVTPQVRYLAFRSWLIRQYGNTELPDSWNHFEQFSLKIESALVLSNLIQDAGIGGLIGADRARVLLESAEHSIAIEPLLQTPAASTYTGPSDQLGITKPRDDYVPSLTDTRGLPLAKLVEDRFSSIPALSRLISHPSTTSISLEELSELGAVARIDQIPPDEREALLASIIPSEPFAGELPRIATYTSLLSLAEELGAPPSETDIFDAACSKRRFGDALLDHAADGWAMYCVRDDLSVTQESVLSAVMAEVTASAEGNRSGVQAASVIEALMERVEEHSQPLRDLGIATADESVEDFSFCQLYHRIEQQLEVGLEQRGGLARWDAPLCETRLYYLSMRAGSGALTLALVAWILAELRVGQAVRKGAQEVRGLSYHGWRRMGLQEVVLPELERFKREDRPVRNVAAGLAYRTVNQHLQIAWSRLQADPARDVALITTDGVMWYSRNKNFSGGRTLSRLPQCLGWLKQLELIDEDGITTDGKDIRDKGLRILEAEGIT